MEPAPFHQELAEGPDSGRAVWCHADDGVRVRVGFWPKPNAPGSILLFPGRTEHIEKYGRVAADAAERGFAVAAIDWRGQGLSDRVAKDPRVGHVGHFAEYQRDVAAFVGLATQELPRPWYLIAHSMGGCIGLRSLVEGLDVERTVFSAPMWGIQMPLPARPFTRILPPLATIVGRGEAFAPSTQPTNYIVDTEFEENTLTGDRATFAWLRRHATTVEGFALGGPSVQWIGAASREMAALASLPRPSLPVRTYLGTKEAIVSANAIHRMHANWPNAELRIVEGARHEFMMETEALRRPFLDETFAFFSSK